VEEEEEEENEDDVAKEGNEGEVMVSSQDMELNVIAVVQRC